MRIEICGDIEFVVCGIDNHPVASFGSVDDILGYFRRSVELFREARKNTDPVFSAWLESRRASK